MLNTLKVGYLPYSTDLSEPGDRRRFVWFANIVGMKFEIADLTESYDILYVVNGCNIGNVLEYKQNHLDTKLVFELVDAQLLRKTTLYTFLKSTLRFLMGRESVWVLDYRSLIKDVVSVSDAVVCSTVSQKEYLNKLNNNVHVSIDSFSSEIRSIKSSYARDHRKLTILWEGKIYNLKYLEVLNKCLQSFGVDIEVIVLTDNQTKSFLGYSQSAAGIMKRFSFNCKFVEWSHENLCEYSLISDVAIIPLDLNDGIAFHKPENKLVFLWSLGLPVITSATPAYESVMVGANVSDYLCYTDNDWERILKVFMDKNEDDIKNDMSKVRHYIQCYYSDRDIIDAWRNIFNNI